MYAVAARRSRALLCGQARAHRLWIPPTYFVHSALEGGSIPMPPAPQRKLASQYSTTSGKMMSSISSSLPSYESNSVSSPEVGKFDLNGTGDRNSNSAIMKDPSSAIDDGLIFKYRPVLSLVVRMVAEDSAMTSAIETKHIPSKLWLTYLMTKRRSIMKNCGPFLSKYDLRFEDSFIDTCNSLSFIENFSFVIGLDAIKEVDKNVLSLLKQNIFELLSDEAEIELADDIMATKTIKSCSDLTIPHEWYPYARLLKRKIIYHGGPTNSGKTYQALQRLKNADPAKGGGLYCGPLRLLALEVYEKLNREGVHTDLVTGQELREIPFSTHVSATVEMVNINRMYDVAVVDEIQMIADSQRGWGWTRVLQGLHAREIHLCGGLETFEVVKSLVESMDDEFTFHKYERLSKLKIAETSLEGDYSKIEPGDCVVAFSRADIFSIRKQIERLTSHKCAIIYGQLPPEIRSEQARLFNEGSAGHEVLVASDAIGMGLNLNIKRIIFHSVNKYTRGADGKMEFKYVEASHIKQIGGRAGRLSSQYKEGVVTAWQNVDLAYVKAVMDMDVPQINKAGIFPSVEQIKRFSQSLNKFKIDSAVSLKQNKAEDSDILSSIINDSELEANPGAAEGENKPESSSPSRLSLSDLVKLTQGSVPSVTAPTAVFDKQSSELLQLELSKQQSVSSSVSDSEVDKEKENSGINASQIDFKQQHSEFNQIRSIYRSIKMFANENKINFVGLDNKAVPYQHVKQHQNIEMSKYLKGNLYSFRLAKKDAKLSQIFIPVCKEKKEKERDNWASAILSQNKGDGSSSDAMSGDSSSSSSLAPTIGSKLALPPDHKIRLGLLLDRFVDSSQTDGRYFICDYLPMLVVSNWLHAIPLSLEDRFIFANAPCNTNDLMIMNMLYTFAATYAMGRPVAINIRLPRGQPKSFLDFQELCAKHSILELYSWLSRRFPKFFVERDICIEQQLYGQKLIQETLFSGKMQHEYSHSAKYKLKRTNLDLESILPPESPYGLELREKMREYLSAIPQSEWTKFPRAWTEDSGGFGDNGGGSVGDGKWSNKSGRDSSSKGQLWGQRDRKIVRLGK